MIKYPLYIHKKLYKVLALHAICTKKEFREKGLASELIQKIIQASKRDFEFLILFTEIPKFYEKFSFKCVQKYRFELKSFHTKGTKNLKPLCAFEDQTLFKRLFFERTFLSSQLTVKDNGFISSFNCLFATYPYFWSLYYSPF